MVRSLSSLSPNSFEGMGSIHRLTLTPLAKFALAEPSVIVVVPGSKATLPGANVAVIAALMVMLGAAALYDDTVAPAGIPQPDMPIELTILESA